MDFVGESRRQDHFPFTKTFVSLVFSSKPIEMNQIMELVMVEMNEIIIEICYIEEDELLC